MSESEFIAHQAKHAKRAPESTGGDERETGSGGLHEKIINYCKIKGWIYFHGSTAHRAFRTIGEPDFTILADGGRVFFFEAKSKTGKLSTEQLGLKVWAERLGHKIETVRSLQEMIEIIASDYKSR